jgi:hypothetical protein
MQWNLYMKPSQVYLNQCGVGVACSAL